LLAGIKNRAALSAAAPMRMDFREKKYWDIASGAGNVVYWKKPSFGKYLSEEESNHELSGRI
jgi:hypothetical protein